MNILLSRGILDKFKDSFQEYIKPKMKVCILAYSYFSNQFQNQEEYEAFYTKDGEYYQKMIDMFNVYQISEDDITFILYQKDSKEEALEKIKNADIIYFPGGAPDLMMKRIKKMELKNALESKEKIYIGSSAGAMIQFELFHITKDYDYHKFSFNEGLNLLNSFFIEVHYRHRKIQKKSFKKIYRMFKQKIYAIPDDGAIVVLKNKIITYNTARLIYPKSK